MRVCAALHEVCVVQLNKEEGHCYRDVDGNKYVFIIAVVKRIDRKDICEQVGH